MLHVSSYKYFKESEEEKKLGYICFLFILCKYKDCILVTNRFIAFHYACIYSLYFQISDIVTQIGELVRSDLCYSIKSVTNQTFSLRKDLFSFIRAHDVLAYLSISNKSTMPPHPPGCPCTNSELISGWIRNIKKCRILNPPF